MPAFGEFRTAFAGRSGELRSKPRAARADAVAFFAACQEP